MTVATLCSKRVIEMLGPVIVDINQRLKLDSGPLQSLQNIA